MEEAKTDGSPKDMALGCFSLIIIGAIAYALLSLFGCFSSDPPKAAPTNQTAVANPTLTPEQDDVLLAIRQVFMPVTLCTSSFDATQRLINQTAADKSKVAEAYSAAHQGEKNCASAQRDLPGEFRAPVGRKIYSDNRAACLATIRSGHSAMTRAKAILDGDDKLASMQAFKDDRDAMAGKLIECKLALAGIAQRAKIPEATVDFLKP